MLSSSTAGRVCAALIALAAAGASADIAEGRYHSSAWGVEVEAPRNWQLSEQTSYPNILLWISRRNPDGKILLTAEKLSSTRSARDYAHDTRKVLQSIGFKVRAPQLHPATGAFWTDFDDGSSYLRQAYLIKDGVGFTLTLSAESSRLRNQLLRAFDGTLRSLTFIEREADANPAGSPGPAAGSASGTAGE